MSTPHCVCLALNRWSISPKKDKKEFQVTHRQSWVFHPSLHFDILFDFTSVLHQEWCHDQIDRKLNGGSWLLSMCGTTVEQLWTYNCKCARTFAKLGHIYCPCVQNTTASFTFLTLQLRYYLIAATVMTTRDPFSKAPASGKVRERRLLFCTFGGTRVSQHFPHDIACPRRELVRAARIPRGWKQED